MKDSIDTFYSYIDIIDPRLLRHLGGKSASLIELLKGKKYISEEELIQAICGNQHSREYYQNLKSKTLEILQVFALVHNSGKSNPVKSKYEICQKKFLLGQKFLTNNQQKEGIRLIRQAYKIAVAYDFTYQAGELASILYHHHLYYEPNYSKADYYWEQSERHIEAYLAEKRAEHHVYQALRRDNRTNQAERFQNALSELERQTNKSVKFRVYQAVLEVHLGFVTNDYTEVAKTCRGMIEYLKDKKGAYLSHNWSFHKNLGIAQLLLENFRVAAKSFERAAQYTSAKSFNYHLLGFYQTLNALHAADYPTAYELYRQNRRCRFPTLRLQFAIIEAYLCFLSHTGHLHIDRIFRLGKYLNETIKAQADKQGDNLNVIIAELLILLARDRGKFIDRIEAVQHYSYRYLRGDDTRRAYWFIKILCLLPKVNFHPAALERRAKSYIEKLTTHPIASGENFAIEIIPFDRLLQIILQQLQQRVA